MWGVLQSRLLLLSGLLDLVRLFELGGETMLPVRLLELLGEVLLEMGRELLLMGVGGVGWLLRDRLLLLLLELLQGWRDGGLCGMNRLGDGAWDIVMGLGKLRRSGGLRSLSAWLLLLCLLLLLENGAKGVGRGWGGGRRRRMFKLRLGLYLGGRLLGRRNSDGSCLRFTASKGQLRC
jgi:hypothetical protein